MHAINIKEKSKRYSFIYDTVCDYIDKKYLECNYCDFKDDVCVFFRNHPKIMHKDGCCYSDARGGLCENLKNHRCQIKSISCKLYSCEYLRNKKVYFKIKDIPLLKYFFSNSLCFPETEAPRVATAWAPTCSNLIASNDDSTTKTLSFV